MRFLLILFCFLISSGNIYAQENREWPEFRGRGTFSTYVRDQLAADSGLGMIACVRLVTALKFAVDENGFVTDIQVSENVTGYIGQRIKLIARSSDGTWDTAMSNGKAVKSKPMMVLIYLSLEGPCTKEDRYVGKDKITGTFHEIFKLNKKGEEMNTENIKIFPPVTFLSPHGLTDLTDN
ncbi:MAG: hypothetical protein AAFQ94_24175 [Bacteroidota bacterium]